MLARGARAEHLQAVSIDPVARRLRDGGRHALQAVILDARRPAARRAHDVMVVGGLTGDERMLPGREIEALDNAELGQEVQGPKHGRAVDAQTPAARIREQSLRREVTALLGDESGEGAARRRSTVARLLQDLDDLTRLDHARSIP